MWFAKTMLQSFLVFNFFFFFLRLIYRCKTCCCDKGSFGGMCFFSSLLGICDNSCIGKNRKFYPNGVTSPRRNSMGVSGDGGTPWGGGMALPTSSGSGMGRRSHRGVAWGRRIWAVPRTEPHQRGSESEQASPAASTALCWCG